MSDVIIYHNPRCSKSRQTLALLENNNIQHEVVLYLESKLSRTQLTSILTKLGFSPRQLLRKGEDAYKEQNLGNADLSDSDLITAMVESPILIERPIVVRGDRAKIGRPPEQVLEILD
jgi:arsenate reductase